MANALNAKNIPFTEPGAGLALGGVTSRNLYAKYDKLRGVRDEKSGGSKQLWDNLSRWTSTKQGTNLEPQQAQLFNEYIKTGVKPAGLTDQTASAAMDWGLREAGRFQQHKPISLLEKIAGPVLTIAASAIPVIGPYAGAAVGGYIGQRNGGGVMGGLLGAAGGYLGGRSIANAGGVSGIADKVRTGFQGLTGGGGFTNTAALGLRPENIGLNFASAPGGFAAAPVAGYGASGLGLTGANLGLNFASGALSGAPVAGYGANALGGDPSSLYTPQSMGPPKPSIGDRIVDTIGSLPGLPVPQGNGGGGGGPAIGGPTQAPNVTLPPPTVDTLPPPGAPEFDAVLMGGGRGPGNALAMSGMGAGLLPDRGMGRVPGYQLRPFGNYLMRP